MKTKILNLFIKFKKHMAVVYVVLLIISISTSVYYYVQSRKLKTVIIKPRMELKKTAQLISDRVENMVSLEFDEEPQIYPITPQSPRNQSFLEAAKTGDYLLIYFRNKKAILYDPNANIILKVGPLALTSISPAKEKTE